jgi:HAD superfamily hydrolase (TIGR01450 family)
MSRLDLSGKKLFLFDLDGVFYKGKESRIKIGGSTVVERIRSSNKRLFVLTNNSTDTTETIHSNLTQLGISVRRNEILSSSLLTAAYLSERYGRATYYLVGEAGFDKELQRVGHREAHGTNADVVAIGLDRFVTYDKLDTATKFAKSGADLVATHISRIYMSKNGPALGPGPFVRAIEYASGKRATSIGKPSPLMFRMALKTAGCRPEEAVMIGDQLDTDILGADRAGIDSILVLTGVDRSIEGTRAMGTVRNVDDLAKYI